MDREQQVLWLGMGLVFANFFFTGQFKSLWSVFATKPSGSSGGPGNPLAPLLPLLPIIPPVGGTGTTPQITPIPNSTVKPPPVTGTI